MRKRLPWIITTVALFVAAVAVTLLVTGKDESPSPTLTVKRAVDCQTDDGTPSDECRVTYDAVIARACTEVGVQAVEVVVQYQHGDSVPVTRVCAEVERRKSSSSGPPTSN